LKAEKPKEIISTAKLLGFNSIGLNKQFNSDEIDIIQRHDLEPKNPTDLKNQLRKNRWHFEIITVKCLTKAVARQAGRDRRVDLISFPLIDEWKRNHLDKQQANLMKASGCGYLIDLSLLLTDDPDILRKRILFLKRNIDNALKNNITIVASSCAKNALELRDPYGLVALLSLLNVKQENALEMISTAPWSLVEKNRAKLKDSYIAQGVWVIEDE